MKMCQRKTINYDIGRSLITKATHLYRATTLFMVLLKSNSKIVVCYLLKCICIIKFQFWRIVYAMQIYKFTTSKFYRKK